MGRVDIDLLNESKKEKQRTSILKFMTCLSSVTRVTKKGHGHFYEGSLFAKSPHTRQSL